MPKISVIIPAHNEEAYLGDTLQSLRGQNFLNYETIIICNGCADRTEEVARSYANQNTKILFLDKANVSLARNRGADHALGELLLFLDADTCLEQNSLSKIEREFDAESAVATTKTMPDLPKLKYRLAAAFKNIYNLPWIYQGCSGVLVCRKEDFHQVGGYPELKVKEHRKLIIKLKQKGRYKLINTHTITSMRRFERWGLAKVTYFWIREWVKNYFSDLKKSEYEQVR